MLTLNDPFVVAIVAGGFSLVAGCLLQYVAARASRKRDRDNGGLSLIDQQRSLIRELRSQLEDAWARDRSQQSYIRELERRLKGAAS